MGDVVRTTIIAAEFNSGPTRKRSREEPSHREDDGQEARPRSSHQPQTPTPTAPTSSHSTSSYQANNEIEMFSLPLDHDEPELKISIFKRTQKQDCMWWRSFLILLVVSFVAQEFRRRVNAAKSRFAIILLAFLMKRLAFIISTERQS